MKKILLSVICFVLLFGLVGCDIGGGLVVSPTPTPDPNDPLVKLQNIMPQIIQSDIFRSGVYDITCTYEVDVEKTIEEMRSSTKMNGQFMTNEDVTYFSFLADVIDHNDNDAKFNAGFYYAGESLYMMNPDRDNNPVTYKVDPNSYPYFDVYKDLCNFVDVKKILTTKMAIYDITYTENQDGSHVLKFPCDLSIASECIEDINMECSIEDTKIEFNTTKCEVTLELSKDLKVTKMSIIYAQSAISHDVVYEGKYELSYVGAEGSITLPEGMVIENAKTAG